MESTSHNKDRLTDLLPRLGWSVVGQRTPALAVAASPPPGDEQRRLVEAACRGDKAAFDRLVGALEGQLRGFLLRRVGPNAVDDLLQDVWLACWVGLSKFDRRSGFKTWLYGIALHKCTDHYRALNRSAAASASVTQAADLCASGSGVDFQSPEQLYAQAELRDVVRVLLDTLPPTQQEVVELYYYAELTLPEIAAALKRNLNTVKYQFYRAHDQVARGLERAGEPFPGAIPPR